MPDQSIQSLNNKDVAMFLNYNLWARDQIVLFFLTNEKEKLADYLIDNAQSYYNLLYDRLVARITYQGKRIKGYKESFFTDLPYYIYIPQNYKVFTRDTNYISFLWRSRENVVNNPDKYVSIYTEQVNENILDKDWISQKRQYLAWTYHDEDEFDETLITSGYTKFGNRDVIYIRGNWQNKKHFIGGAFQTFAFYEDSNNTIYLIDTNIYFPAGYKLLYLLETEGLARTLIPKVL
jgi:hypothetical protein